jgi:cell wall-associated NlpC family hydrolase
MIAAGDLVFPEAGHVQMYIGDGRVVEAPHSGANVQISHMSSSVYAIRRPLP